MVTIQINSTTGSELVSTSELKDYARIETSADDTLIGILITSARTACEDYMNRDIVAKTRSYFRSNIPESSGDYFGLYKDRYKIVIPYAPIDTITSVQKQNSDGTFSNVNYESYGLTDKYILLSGNPNDDIKIAYSTSGLTNSAIKLAIMQLATTYYDNRTDFVAGNISELPTSVKKILDPFKFISDI